MPILAQIEPTNRCDLACSLCVVGLRKLARPQADLSLAKFTHIIDQLEDSLLYLVLYNFGEPLLNDDIYKMITYAKQRRIFIRLSTSGHFLDRYESKKIVSAGIDELIVSLDYPTPELYLKFKRNDGFLKVIDNVQSMVRERAQWARPFIRLQLLLTRDTEGMVYDFKALARRLGVDGCVIKKVRIDFPGVNSNSDILPRKQKYIRRKYVGKDFKKRCIRPWLSTVILSDGSVIPCCFDVNGESAVGNIATDTFKEIWNNERYESFRSNILKNINAVPLCRKCSINNFSENFVQS